MKTRNLAGKTVKARLGPKAASLVPRSASALGADKRAVGKKIEEFRQAGIALRARHAKNRTVSNRLSRRLLEAIGDPALVSEYIKMLDAGEIFSVCHGGETHLTVVPDALFSRLPVPNLEAKLSELSKHRRNLMSLSDFRKWAIPKHENLKAPSRKRVFFGC